jgi:Mor family transcriptional regulator
MATGVPNWPEGLAETYDLWLALLREQGFAMDKAQELAEKAVTRLAEYRGGRSFYLPKNDSLQRAIRDRDIWHSFNGRNKHQLAKKHNLTTRAIELIVTEQRALHVESVQPELF